MTCRRLAIVKICPACNQEFHPFASKQVYCSRICKGDTHAILTCENCGKEYRKNGSLAKRVKHHNYCSFECKSTGRRTAVKCETCNKTFERIKSWLSPDKKNYCSRQCADRGLRVVKPILTCAFCGKEFERYPSEIRKMSERGYTHVFCGHKCRAAMIAAQFDPPRPYMGEHTSVPRNGAKTREWRKAVFERNSHTCQDCGITNVLMCAHHIKPYALYTALRYEVSNGLTLCYPCHEKRHSLS